MKNNERERAFAFCLAFTDTSVQESTDLGFCKSGEIRAGYLA